MKITVIGAGNMGGAIAEGAVKKGVVDPRDMTISDPLYTLADKLRNEGLAVNYTTDNTAAVAAADLVVVAVKPWLMEEVLGDIAPALDRTRQSVISIAAGISFEQLAGYLSCATLGPVALYRVIPNTAISIGQSVTFIAKHDTTPQSDAQVLKLFGELGQVFEIGEEQMTAGTALASSGIAYAFKYIDVAMRGGEAMGFGQREALRIVMATVKGAVAMLEANGRLPQAEIDRVTTRGGLTLKGLEAMERGGFSDAVIDGLKATK